MKAGTALTLGVAMLAAAAVSAIPASAANSQTFIDSTGENPSAPDITSIVVSNDNAGLITFKINLGNRPALTADMSIILVLDTDRKASTGDPQAFGADYAIELDPGAVNALKWNGSNYVEAPSQTSITYSYDTTGATIHASAAELGRTTGFNFYSVAFSGITTDAMGNADFTNAQTDVAPDPGHGVYTYKVLTKLTLSIKALTVAPKPAQAGRKLTASLAATESDTKGPVEAGTVACRGTVAGKHLSATAHRVANGVATCSWLVPRTAKGTVKGTISLTVNGTTVSRSFTDPVK